MQELTKQIEVNDDAIILKALLDFQAINLFRVFESRVIDSDVTNLT